MHLEIGNEERSRFYTVAGFAFSSILSIRLGFAHGAYVGVVTLGVGLGQAYQAV